MSNDTFRSVLESVAAEDSASKSRLLEALQEKLDVASLRNAVKIVRLIENWREFPIEHSRFVLSDLQRRIDCISWDEMASAISGIAEIIDECVTVAGGDCDNCMGDELVFMWDSAEETVVRHCKLCGNTIDLSGAIIAETASLEEATTQQLADAGVAF